VGPGDPKFCARGHTFRGATRTSHLGCLSQGREIANDDPLPLDPDEVIALARDRLAAGKAATAIRLAEAVLGVPAARRGWLALGRVMLETRYPLGLFRAWSYVEPDAQALVYPVPEYSALPAPRADARAGGGGAQAQGNEDFSGLRDYQRSDSPRHVAWKAFARGGAMLTKQFAGEASAELWLDWQDLPRDLSVEARLSRLTGWVLSAEKAGARYGLRLPGAEFAPARGESHRNACLEALALYRIEG